LLDMDRVSSSSVSVLDEVREGGVEDVVVVSEKSEDGLRTTITLWKRDCLHFSKTAGLRRLELICTSGCRCESGVDARLGCLSVEVGIIEQHSGQFQMSVDTWKLQTMLVKVQDCIMSRQIPPFACAPSLSAGYRRVGRQGRCADGCSGRVAECSRRIPGYTRKLYPQSAGPVKQVWWWYAARSGRATESRSRMLPV
jgi:hypothetical protein